MKRSATSTGAHSSKMQRTVGMLLLALILLVGIGSAGAVYPTHALGASGTASTSDAPDAASTPGTPGASIPQAWAASTTMGTQAKTYDIVFKLNGGTQASNQITSIAKGKTLKVSKLKAPKRARYKFAGWYTNRALTEKATTLKGVADASKRTVYAKWNLKSYNIIYSLNGGTFQGKHTKTIGKNKTLKARKLVEPVRSGYVFAGWYTDKKLKTEAKTLRGVSDPYKRTVYAKWEPLSYVISYELNGGIFEDSYPTSYQPITGVSTLPTPMRSGFSFVGWYSDSALTRHVTSIPANTLGNQLLYAKWAERIKIAHRGYCAGGAAANSLDAFKAAADKGYAYVAADVRFLRDGTAVLATSDGRTPPEPTYLDGMVQKTYTELGEFLELCKDRKLTPYLELSGGTQPQIESLVSTVDARKMTTPVRWASSSTELLGYIQAIHPQASFVVLTQNVSDSVIQSANNLAVRGADVMLGTDASHGNAQAISKCREAGISLGIWTLSNEGSIPKYDQFVSLFAIAG